MIYKLWFHCWNNSFKTQKPLIQRQYSMNTLTWKTNDAVLFSTDVWSIKGELQRALWPYKSRITFHENFCLRQCSVKDVKNEVGVNVQPFPVRKPILPWEEAIRGLPFHVDVLYNGSQTLTCSITECYHYSNFIFSADVKKIKHFYTSHLNTGFSWFPCA